jgi:predicted dienelactone hydrolase
VNLSVKPIFGRVQEAIKVPVYVVVGDKDDQAIPEYNAKLIAALIPGAELQILPNVTHYTFLPICNERGNSQVKELFQPAWSRSQCCAPASYWYGPGLFFPYVETVSPL